MNGNRRLLAILFAALVLMMLGGILVHQTTGYAYPATKANDYEFNTLNDLYELFVFVPVGILALFLLRKGSHWGPVIISGAAVWTMYNYAMMVTGKQNMWILLWTAKLAVSGPLLILAWRMLPPGRPLAKRTAYAMSAYLAVTGLAFGKLMLDRLIASAHGQMVNMAMVGVAKADWADPALRDPIVFFVSVLPVLVAAIAGLLRGSADGRRFTTLMSTFLVGMVSVILFTGPFKEFLVSGAVSMNMMGMSVFMTVFTIPAILWLNGVVRGGGAE